MCIFLRFVPWAAREPGIKEGMALRVCSCPQALPQLLALLCQLPPWSPFCQPCEAAGEGVVLGWISRRLIMEQADSAMGKLELGAWWLAGLGCNQRQT